MAREWPGRLPAEVLATPGGWERIAMMPKEKSKRWIGFLLVFSLSFALCLLVTTAYVRNKSNMEFAQMEQLVLTRANKINNVITKLLYKTQVLSALVIQNNGEIREFERVAATIVDDPAIRNVLVAPGGVVSHVYPREGNEKVLGFNYFTKSEGNQESIAAKERGQLVLGGPFHLVQGGQALVGRLPVYLGERSEKDFWGLVSVTLNYPQALDGAELDQLKNQGFAYEIWRISPDTNARQIIAHSDYDYNRHARYVEKPMSILNADWYFRLSPIRNWYEYPETWIFTIAGLLISLLIASLVMHNCDLQRMKAELEDITYNDALTGTLNRRGVFQALEALLAEPQAHFTLCYIDLNQFKSINDTYGHNTGDQMLRQFAAVFMRRIQENHIFARIGGDEFIFICKEAEEAVDAFFAQVRADLRQAVVEVPGGALTIAFSMGKASYPADGKTIDALIASADSEMYREKMRAKEL